MITVYCICLLIIVAIGFYSGCLLFTLVWCLCDCDLWFYVVN